MVAAEILPMMNAALTVPLKARGTTTTRKDETLRKRAADAVAKVLPTESETVRMAQMRPRVAKIVHRHLPAERQAKWPTTLTVLRTACRADVTMCNATPKM